MLQPEMSVETDPPHLLNIHLTGILGGSRHEEVEVAEEDREVGPAAAGVCRNQFTPFVEYSTE